MLPPPPTPTSGSSVGSPPPATAKNNEKPPLSSLIIPKASPPISQKKTQNHHHQLLLHLLQKDLEFGKLTIIAMSTFLRTHLGTINFDQQDFPESRDFVQKKQKYLKKKKKKKKESPTLSDNKALNILERSLQELFSTKKNTR